MAALSTGLVLLALVLWFFGFAMLTQATQGVGAVAMACLLAILARMAQAAEHQRVLLRHLQGDAASDAAPRPVVPTAPPADPPPNRRTHRLVLGGVVLFAVGALVYQYLEAMGVFE